MLKIKKIFLTRFVKSKLNRTDIQLGRANTLLEQLNQHCNYLKKMYMKDVITSNYESIVIGLYGNFGKMSLPVTIETTTAHHQFHLQRIPLPSAPGVWCSLRSLHCSYVCKYKPGLLSTQSV